MNFSLKSSKKSRKSSDSSLGFGLNSRKKTSFTALGGKSSSEDENDDRDTCTSSREKVNRELAAEQAALRRRAEKAMTAFSVEYDYDAEYDSFSSNSKQKSAHEKIKDDGPKQSRYIENLLEKAKERQQEREIIKERRIAKEQDLEDLNKDFMGKENFVTSAYKRKLEERKAWLEKDEKRSKREEEEDVTKRKGGGVLGFYSNFTKNVAVGAVQKDSKSNHKLMAEKDNIDMHECTEISGNRNLHKKSNEDDEKPEDLAESDGELELQLQEQASTVRRLQKIFDARERYMKRKLAVV